MPCLIPAPPAQILNNWVSVAGRFKDTMVNTIGHRAAERALQLGMLFPPTEALQVGIVDQVVPEDQVHSTALKVMAQWLAIPGEGMLSTYRPCFTLPTHDSFLHSTSYECP